MDNQSQDNSLDQTIKDSQVTSGVINKDLPFIPIEEMFSTPEYDAYIDSADLSVIQEMAEVEPFINNNALSGSYGNMSLNRPTLATDTYDPVLQQNPLNKEDPEYFNRLMEMNASEVYGEPAPGKKIVAPVYAGIRQSNFLRYYNHPKFNELGFTPYSDMETYYNANSTAYDDSVRMWGQYTSLAAVGFKSSYRAIGDYFTGGSFSPDLESADEFADAMAIGNSSRGGALAWTNNMMLNSAYTMGIIGSIAVEEIALAAIAGLQGGLNPASDAMLMTATARNIARLKKVGSTVANSFSVSRMASQTRNMARSLKSIDNARDFWSMQKGVTAGSALNFFAPETVAAIRNLKSTANSAQNMANLAKQSTVFGGFYRDLRSLNLALAESKLEAGMVYNDMIRENSDLLSQENFGRPITPEQMNNIQDKASKAAFKTTLINTPLIFATNQLVLGNAFGGFNKSFARMMNDKVSDVGRRIIKTKSVTNPFKDAGTGIAGAYRTIVSAGVKGNLKKAASGTVRYFAANFGEGIQELGQEAISVGTKGYYTTLLKDPLAGGMDLFNENFSSAVGSQFSAQGFDTFMSGFLMGGVVAGPQKLFFQGIPAIYKRTTDSKGYAEHKANRQAFVDSVVKSYNDVYSTKGEIFDKKKFSFLIQNQISKDQTTAAQMANIYDFIDQADFAKFQQIYDVISTGGAQYFEQQMKDYINLSDGELAEGFPTSKKDIKSGKTRERFQDMIGQIGKMEDNYTQLRDKFPNPFNESAFNRKTQQSEYNEELAARIGWDHATYLAMFTRDGFERALERSNSIFETLAKDPLFKNMGASDITVLLDKDSLDKELSFLEVEIDNLKEDKSQTDLVKEKQEKIKKLSAIKEVLNDSKNLTKDGSFDRRKIGKLRNDFSAYVKFMAKKSGSFVNQDAIDEALKLIVDHGALKGRAKVYNKTIEALANPKKFKEVFERSKTEAKAIYRNREKLFRESLDKYLNTVEQNRLFNEIDAVEGAFGTPIPEILTVIQFANTNNVDDLAVFYNERGIISPANDPVAFNEINRLKAAYAKAAAPTQEEVDSATEEAQTAENRQEIQDIIKDIDVEIPAVESEVLTSILKRAYRKYERTQAIVRKKSLKYKDWVNTKEGEAFREAYIAIKKIWINNDKEVLSADRQLTQEQINNDAGLMNWLTSLEGRNNDLVGQVLNKLNISLSDFSGQNITLSETGEKLEGNSNYKIEPDLRGSVISVRTKKAAGPNGNIGDVYEIIDSKTGEKISGDMLQAAGVASDINFFSEKDKAKDAWNLLKLNMPSDGTFDFDGIGGLSFGTKVYSLTEKDDNGNPAEYIIFSNSDNVIRRGTLTLIPASAVLLSSQEKKDNSVYINLKPGQFNEFYQLEDKDFQLLPASVSRITYSEPVTPYGGKNPGENNWSLAKERYYQILNVLSYEDIKTLELVVIKDPEGGLTTTQYSIGSLEPNPYIINKKSKYQIGIRTSSSIVQSKIDALFSSNDSDGKPNAFVKLDNDGVDTKIFAYMPNDSFQFFGGVDPMALTRQQLNQVIGSTEKLKSKLTKAQILDKVRDNWTKQSLLVSEVDRLMKNVPDGSFLTITQNDLSEGLFFNSILGNVVYDKEARGLKDLVNEGAADNSGNYLVYQLEQGKTGRGRIPISNLSGTELEALENKVENAIGKSELNTNLLQGSDAYKAVVLLTDGTYRIVPLKSQSFSPESLDALLVEVFERAQLTQKENKDGKNPTFNNQFNQELREDKIDPKTNQIIRNGLFISGYNNLNISLQVDMYGKVQLQVLNGEQQFYFTLDKAEVNSKVTLKVKLNNLLAKANQSDLFKNSTSSPQAGNKKGLELSTNNFKKSYGREVGIDELIEKTATNAKPQVAGVSKIEIGADSAFIQAKKITTATQSTKTLEQIAEESNTAELRALEEETLISEVTEEEFKEFTDNAAVSDARINAIANKIKAGIELTTQEQAMREEKAEQVEEILKEDITSSEVTELEKLNQKLDTLKDKLVAGKDIKKHRKILKTSAEYQKLLKEIKNFGNIANKIAPALTQQDVEDIDVFVAWASENLPDFISIEDINTLGNNMKSGGVRVGAFGLNLNHLAGGLNISGTLYTGANSPYRYHEAFHGVFRMLLTDAEINKYLSFARKEVRANLRAEGKNFEQELNKFRNSADTYSNMSRSRLEQEYYEEYLANEFEKFKTNPRSSKTDSSVKSLFTRILEWIKSFFNSYNKNELLTLFENIDGGKYRTSATMLNQFTTGLSSGVTLEANALIPYKKITDKDSNNEGYLYLDSLIADPLIRSIAAMYLSRVSKVTNPNINRGDILEEVMDDFYQLYNSESEQNKERSETQKEILDSITNAFDNYDDSIKDQVYDILNVIDGQIAEEEYNTEYFEDAVGVRASSQWNTDASLIGGINSTPKMIRAYIATTTMDATDFFGNSELVLELKNDKGVVVRKAESLIIPVPFTEVYNGLLKSVKNITDPKKMLQTMYFFGQENAATGAVVSRILQDIGISTETLLNDSPLPKMQDPLLFQSITKAFENFRVDYLFTQRDLMGNIITYSAAQRDDINSQVDEWSQAWNDAFKKIKLNTSTASTVEKTLVELIGLLKETDKKSSRVATEDARKYSRLLFDLTGIRISAQYLKYSILYNRVEAGNVFSETIENEDGTKTTEVDHEQKALIDLHKYEDEPLTSEVIREMYTLVRDKENIFSDGEDGMRSRLVKIAQGNAPFDETIGLSVFRNTEGNLVYAHQKPTFHLKQIEALNNPATLESKKEDLYLENNHLLNNPAFIEMSNLKRQRVIRVAGTKVGELNSTEEEINENISGVSYKSTYGNFTPQEFASSLINSYTALVNTKSNKVDYVEIIDPITNERLKVALAPSLIRVLESSNTGDMMYMPIIRAVEFESGNSGAVKITDNAIDVYINSIDTEYKRIQRESNPDTKTEEQIVGYNIEGYDEAGEPLPMKAYTLHNSSLLLTSDLKDNLEEIAKRFDGTTLEQALLERNITMDQLKSEVREKLDLQFEEFKSELEGLGVDMQISQKIKQGLIGKGGKATPTLVESNYLLNLTDDFNYNLKQIFLNDWINTQAINEIFLGDQAVTLKNGVDAIKRAKAQNAAYISAYSSISAPEQGINHNVDDISLIAIEEIKEISALTGNNIDVADAQMWMTPKASRYMSFGFGQLTPSIAALYDKIDQGEEVTSWQMFGESAKVVKLEEETYIVKGKKIFDNNNVEVLIDDSKARTEILELAEEEKPIRLDGYVNQDNAMLNSKKLVYFDGTTFIKMSAFMLSRQLTSNPIGTNENGTTIYEAKPNREGLHNLLNRLEEIESKKETLGIAAPESALKMLKQRVQPLDRLNQDKPLGEKDYTTLSAMNMGLQSVTPSNKLESIDPTQIKALVTSEQKDETEVPGMLKPDGKSMTVGDIRTLYNEAISQRVEINYKNKRNLIFTFDSAMDELAISKDKGKLTPNLTAFLRYATEGLKASQSSSQLLEFFSTEEGEQKYNLNNPITINKFEQLFLSYLSKGSLAEKQPGLSLTLVSDFGMKVYRRVFSVDENGIPDRSEIIREKVWDKITNKPDIVEFDTLSRSNFPKEGLVVIDRLRSDVKEYDSNGEFTGLRYTEMLMPAHFQSVMDLIENGGMEMPDVISKMFGIRIPSQDNHSTVNIKHVDFLPAFYGSSASFAQELVEISGADFDIDKVYAQIKDFYIKDRKFVEYGKAENTEDKYDDYINYVNEKVNKPGTIYSEAYNLYNKEKQSAEIENVEDEVATDAGLSESGLKALQILGLPISRDKYEKYLEKHGEPYQAPMNNKILDYKYALMGNTAVTEDTVGEELPISYQPAALDILKGELKGLINLSTGETRNLFAERDAEDSIDINNLLGKINAFKNNKGAAIGAIVSPNVNLSLLTEYNVSIEDKSKIININGVSYDNFGVLREKLTKDKDGLRKQDIISSLITMATDDAKERLVAKLGLNRSALNLVGNLTALGVPIRTSLLLVNNPTIQKIYDRALNKVEKLDPGVKKLTTLAIENLRTPANKDLSLVPLTNELLYEAIENEKDLSDIEKISILTEFLKGVEIQEFTRKMSSVSDITTGLGKDISAVNKKKDDINSLLEPQTLLSKNGKIKQINPMMDLSKIYKSKTWQSKYIEIFNQVVDQILPATFLSASTSFQTILNTTLQDVNQNNIEFNEEALAAVSRDLLSYVTIKAYQHNQLKSENNSQFVANLDNNFIYPLPEIESVNSIVKVVDKLRAREDMQDNFFLNSFVQLKSANDISNQTGMNLAEANTFLSMNPLQKIDLQTSFAQIYGTADTRSDALSIVNYMMVKDGLQLKYGSLLDAVSPFIMNDFLSQIDTANQGLRDASDEKMMSTFGLTFDEFQKEFVDGYMQSNVNNALLNTYTVITNMNPNKDTTDTIRKIDRKNKSLVFERNTPEGFNYIRVNYTDNVTSFYITYMRSEVGTGEQLNEGGITDTFIEVPTYGSNQQSGIGFMFGKRPTYAENRAYVSEKNLSPNQPVQDQTFTEDQESQQDQMRERLLKDESANIEATDDGIKVNGKPIDEVTETDVEDNSVSAAGLMDLLNSPAQSTQSTQPTSEFDINMLEYAESQEESDSLIAKGYTYAGKNDDGLPAYYKPTQQTSEVETITYTPKGKEKQTYTVRDNKFFNKKGVEVFKESSVDRNKLSGNLAVQRGQAQVVEYLGKKYLVNKDNKIMSVTTGKIMKWGEDNGDRKAILKLVQPISGTKNELLETEESVTSLDSQLYNQLKLQLEDPYTEIVDYWNKNIKNNADLLTKLKSQNILSLDDLIEKRKDDKLYVSDEQFLESLGCL